MTTPTIDRVNIFVNGKKSYLILDSSKRQTGTAEDFTIGLGRTLSNVKSLKPLMVIFPNNIYNVTANGNVFSINKEGSTLILGIEEGTFTTEEVIDALNAEWALYNILFSYDSTKLKVSVTAIDSLPFSINIQESTISAILGFSSVYDSELLAISHISDTIIRSNPYEFINIKMDIVEQYYGDTLENYFASFPASEIEFGSSAEILFPDTEIIPKKSFFNSIEIQLVDKNFNVIDNNNSDWLLQLQVTFL